MDWRNALGITPDRGFFSRDAGTARRNALAESLDGLAYYVPPELRPWLGIANELNPVVSMERAGTNALTVADPSRSGWERVQALGDMSSNMAGAVAPMVAASRGAVPAANAVEDALMGWSTAAGVPDFMADEFGGVGFRAYHGSPHDFDRFSLDKIGTGEGAQAYGHGLYFAESEGVARSYRDTLSRARHQDPEFWADAQLPRGLSVSEQDEYNMLGAEMRRRGNLPADEMTRWRELRTKRDERETAIAAFKAQNPGRMYEVQINADPADFLDWDKPLSEQPANVRDWFDSRGITPGFAGNQSGAELMMAERSLLGPEGTMVAMRDANVPGIKYLDHGSRFNAMDGIAPPTQTRNYVVFDDKLIEIIRKYGWAAAAPIFAASGLTVEEAQAQYEGQM